MQNDNSNRPDVYLNFVAEHGFKFIVMIAMILIAGVMLIKQIPIPDWLIMVITSFMSYYFGLVSTIRLKKGIE